ncbi:MAG: bis(5'-nucleosyl)-tetraphosphatase (symmetrical) YqeK [Clostridia bacterium]|nr:bis(5'-nucleosyl)-tetraphosphatase (symmetrical) YqeK [Clostridia bacterium]
MRRLGVFGGTFDPIHEGHIELARLALASGQADEVVFVPMGFPAHREPVASPEDRLAMCRLALKGQEGMLLSQAGMASGVRYTSDTLPLLKKEFPDASFALIVGADKLKSLPEWHEAEKILAVCDVLCCPREGIDEAKAVRKAEKNGARVTLLPGRVPPFSSTHIREQTKKYQDALGLCPAVLRYMAERGLYQKDLKPKLKLMMNPRRFQHTLGVRQEAVRLAAKYHLPLQKAALAGLLHDCAKGMSQKDMEKIARKHHLVDDEGMLSSGAMMHGPVGAYLAKKQFGIEDEAVLDAIRNHTIGRPGMGDMELCIFVADATEPNRENYEGLQEIRALADVSLAAAALKSMQLTQAFLEQTNRPFFPIVLETMADLENRLTPEEKSMLNASK